MLKATDEKTVVVPKYYAKEVAPKPIKVSVEQPPKTLDLFFSCFFFGGLVMSDDMVPYIKKTQTLGGLLTSPFS